MKPLSFRNPSRTIRKVALGLAAALSLAIGVVFAAPPAADIDQCANGPSSGPLVCTGAQWQNGNLNINNSHYREGDSVPFRIKLTDMVPGQTYSVTINWQMLNAASPNDAHAYDYLTSYNRTEGTADPCSGIAGCGAFTTFPIPADPTLAAACN